METNSNTVSAMAYRDRKRRDCQRQDHYRYQNVNFTEEEMIKCHVKASIFTGHKSVTVNKRRNTPHKNICKSHNHTDIH